MGEQVDQTVAVTVFVTGEFQEIVIAVLSGFDFSAFEQSEEYVKAYIPETGWTVEKREQINNRLVSYGIEKTLEEEYIRAINWNARWEETIQPIPVGDFLVKPTWTAMPSGFAGSVLLEIDPKMSFGTGYHESTRLVLRMLPAYINKGDRLLDAGTGTGILSIAALKIGAASAQAFDIDRWAIDNANENARRNGVSDRVIFREGSISVISEVDFDVITANINRNVLLGLFPDFRIKIKKGGALILSGLLLEDRYTVAAKAASYGFVVEQESVENQWWAGVFIFDRE